jgi:hypothetical protein
MVKGVINEVFNVIDALMMRFTKGYQLVQPYYIEEYTKDKNFIKDSSDKDIIIEKGERPSSLDVYKTYAIEWEPVEEYLKKTGMTMDELMNTNRGDTGFGNSGK